MMCVQFYPRNKMLHDDHSDRKGGTDLPCRRWVARCEPEKLWFPMLLDQPPVELMGYTRESVVAEKFEAMVKLGELNSRMKDFFDIWLLDFDGSQLAAAIHATFARRATAIESKPVCFTDRFAQDRTKADLWAAFRRRIHVRDVPDFPAVALRVRDFLLPVAVSLAEDAAFSLMWPLCGVDESAKRTMFLNTPNLVTDRLNDLRSKNETHQINALPHCCGR